MKRDPQFKLFITMARKIQRAAGGQPMNILMKYIGFTGKQLREHLEKLMKPGMSWNNYGVVWHIDHIMPASKFKYTSIKDKGFKQCWSLDNLQPLFAEENVKKSNKVPIDISDVNVTEIPFWMFEAIV